MPSVTVRTDKKKILLLKAYGLIRTNTSINNIIPEQ